MKCTVKDFFFLNIKLLCNSFTEDERKRGRRSRSRDRKRSRSRDRKRSRRSRSRERRRTRSRERKPEDGGGDAPQEDYDDVQVKEEKFDPGYDKYANQENGGGGGFQGNIEDY